MKLTEALILLATCSIEIVLVTYAATVRISKPQPKLLILPKTRSNTTAGFTLMVEADNGFTSEHLHDYLFNSEVICDEKTRAQEISEALSMLASVSEQNITRRQTVNNFFIVLNTALVTYLSTNKSPSIKTSCIALVLGLSMCIIWLSQLYYYRMISVSKIELFKALETKRAVRPSTAQYKFCEANKYLGLTTVEQLVPLAFIIGYAILIYFQTGL